VPDKSRIWTGTSAVVEEEGIEPPEEPEPAESPPGEQANREIKIKQGSA
jgi:hypothetical protein